MREIKFRSWDKINKKMEIINAWHFDTNLIDTKSEKRGFSPIKYYEIMQYTGLKDKNGKEIYESDLVIYQGLKGEIKWRDFRWHFFNKDGFCGDIMKGEDFEVIGDIYENPELLGGK